MLKNRQYDSESSEDSDHYDDNADDKPEVLEGESLDISIQSVKSTKSRGRKKIPEKWSRVINLRKDDINKLKVYDLAPDLLLSNAMKETKTRGKKPQKCKQYFQPHIYVKQGHSMKVEDNVITEEQLLKYANIASKNRKLLRDLALNASNDLNGNIEDENTDVY